MSQVVGMVHKETSCGAADKTMLGGCPSRFHARLTVKRDTLKSSEYLINREVR